MPQFAAGAKARASQIGLVGTESVRTANSSNVTGTETVVDTVAVPVVAGRRYKIVWNGAVQSSNATGHGLVAIRLASVSGTRLKWANIATTYGTNIPFPGHLEVFWTATSTATVTFVATLARPVGTGNEVAAASTEAPTCFYVENVSV